MREHHECKDITSFMNKTNVYDLEFMRCLLRPTQTFF